MEKLGNRRSESRIEETKMPEYHGRITEYVELYFDQIIRYFEIKNIPWKEEDQSKRVLAAITANFKVNAAAWYMMHKVSIMDVQDLI